MMPLQRLLAFSVVCILAASVDIPGAPVDLFDEIYARGRPIESTLQTLTARFTETTTSSLLERPVTTRGTLAVVRPSTVVLQYDHPERRTVLIDGEVMRMVWPSRGVDQRTPIGRTLRRIQQFFSEKSPAQLRSQFDIAARNAEDPSGPWFVTMTPKRRQLREGLSQLELWLDRETVMLSAMQMTFPTGDKKRMTFQEVRLNPEIDPVVFRPAQR